MALQNTTTVPAELSLYTAPVKPNLVRDLTDADLKSGRLVTTLT